MLEKEKTYHEADRSNYEIVRSESRMNRYFTVNRIEFAVTYQCNSKCRHCQLGEERERKRVPSHIDKDKAVEIVRKVGEKYGPRSVMTFGGEPLLHPEIVYAIHKEATNVGIPLRDVITNGFWARRTEETEKVAADLVESGVNEVHISVDCFHQEFVPLEIVRKAAEALVKAGMTRVVWNPSWVVSKDKDNVYNRKTKVILEKLRDLPIEISEGNNVRPEGRAIAWLRDFLPPKTKMPKGKCGDMPYTEPLDSIRTVCVEPDGRIAVCKEFYIGNAFEVDVIDIIEDYDPFKIPEAKALIEDGMGGLIDWGRERSVEPNPEGYYNICHLCTDMRRRANLA
jgi:MoaA/NifB/PqqE/SkfB family radical SAM enzyme